MNKQIIIVFYREQINKKWVNLYVPSFCMCVFTLDTLHVFTLDILHVCLHEILYMYVYLDSLHVFTLDTLHVCLH